MLTRWWPLAARPAPTARCSRPWRSWMLAGISSIWSGRIAMGPTRSRWRPSRRAPRRCASGRAPPLHDGWPSGPGSWRSPIVSGCRGACRSSTKRNASAASACRASASTTSRWRRRARMRWAARSRGAERAATAYSDRIDRTMLCFLCVGACSYRKTGIHFSGTCASYRLGAAMLEISGLTKAFGNARTGEARVSVLDGVSFSIPRNQFVCLLGGSGCGKTTLIKIVAGLIAPDAGDIRIEGHAVEGPGTDRSLVFQNYGLLPWRSVLGNVELGLEIAGIARARRRQICRDYIDRVGLTGFENHYPHQISGGMQQS